MAQGLTFDILRGNEMRLTLRGNDFANFINGDDVWMVECRCGFGFADEALQAVSVLSEFDGQEFQCHATFEDGIARQKDFAHATGAEVRKNLVMAEFLPNLYGEPCRLFPEQIFGFEFERRSSKKICRLVVGGKQ